MKNAMRRYKAIERLAIMRIKRDIRLLEEYRIAKQAQARYFWFQVHSGLRMGLRVGAVVLMVILGTCMASGSAHASDIVKIAQSQIGKGEMYGDNKGPQVKAYTRGAEVSWCAGFVSWVVSHAGKGKGYLLSARSYWKVYKENRTQKPRPGDVIVLYRGSRNSNSGHVGIVEKVEGKKITCIEGNVGRFPARVKRVHYVLGEIPNLIGFVRI